jgi:ParB family chromosome partitioning protein
MTAMNADADDPMLAPSTDPLGLEEEPEEDGGESSLGLPPAPAHPAQTVVIPLRDIAEIENARPEYYGIELLAQNMHTQGQLEPCLVRPSPPGAEHGKPYELVYGYRRKRAAELLGWETLRCEVRELQDAEVVERQISENFSREDLSPIAEANAMRRMAKMLSISQAEVARRLGCDRSHVSHRLKLLNLPEPVMTQVDAGQISASVAEVIASLPSEEAQLKLGRLAASHEWTTKKASAWATKVRASEEELKRIDEDEALELAEILIDETIDLPTLPLREDLSEEEEARAALYAMLRSFLDREMLDYIADQYGYGYDELWSYQAELTLDEVYELQRRLVRRYLTAAHRYRSFEPSLWRDLAGRERPEDLDGPHYVEGMAWRDDDLEEFEEDRDWDVGFAQGEDELVES